MSGGGPIWAGSEDVLLCAVRACAIYTPQVLASAQWANSIVPPIPAAPTDWNWPTQIEAPQGKGGGYYADAQTQGADPRAIPFIDLSVGSPYREEYADSTTDFWRVPIAIRARVGLALTNGTTSVPLTRRQAQSLCRAAMIATAAYIKTVAAQLDPAQSAGILWANVITDAPPDVSGPFTPDSYNTGVCDALGMIEVTQRQFSPGGVRAIDLTPPVPPP